MDVETEELARRIRERMAALSVSNDQLAVAAGVSRQAVSGWRSGRHRPSDENLEAIAPVLHTTRGWLLFGDSVGWTADQPKKQPKEPREVIYGVPKRLPPRVYERVHGYLEQLEDAGLSETQIDEVSRLLTEGGYNKLNARDPRERSEEDILMDIDAAWEFVRRVLAKEGVQLADG